jgi:hypothetical protein
VAVLRRKGAFEHPILFLGGNALRTAAISVSGTQRLDRFSSLDLGCFLQIVSPYLQILGLFGRVDVRDFLHIVPATCCCNE